MTRIPLTVIGGFLGAGKTTLLNQVLRHPGGRRIAVLVNDFGEINIDAELVAKHEGRTISLANGCVCCSIGDSLLEALIGLTQQPDLPDHVIIEASGVADPGKIAQIAFLDRSLQPHGVIVVADAERIRELAQDKYVGDTVRYQVAAADILILNKVDLASDIAAQEAAAWLRQQAPMAEIIHASHGAIPIDILLGLDHGHGGTPHDSTGGHHRRHAEEFVTFAFTAERPLNMPTLRRTLDGMPTGVLRAKGLLLTDEDPRRPAILHQVGRRWNLSWGANWASEPQTRLVVIGLAHKLDPEGIRTRLTSALCA